MQLLLSWQHHQRGRCKLRGPRLDGKLKLRREQWRHTPSIAFRHLPPNSARFNYATEGARFDDMYSIFITAQLSSDPVSALQKVPVLIIMTVLRSNLAPKHAHKHETHPPRVKKDLKKRREEFRLDSNDSGFICAGANFVGGYK